MNYTNQAEQYYLCFYLPSLPDLTLTKYNVLDGSGVKHVIEKHGMFLRQLHRLGFEKGVNAHLLYEFYPDETRGSRLKVLFYVTADDPSKLRNIQDFVNSSVLSPYYPLYCYDTICSTHLDEDGNAALISLNGNDIVIDAEELTKDDVEMIRSSILFRHCSPDGSYRICANVTEKNGRLPFPEIYTHAAFVSKRVESVYNAATNTNLFAMMEWEPDKQGRMYQVLKLMEGYNCYAAVRVDLFPVERMYDITGEVSYLAIREACDYSGSGYNRMCDNLLRRWDDYRAQASRQPLFHANIVTLADSEDVAVMLADSIAAEAVGSGTYDIPVVSMEEQCNAYWHDDMPLSMDDACRDSFLPELREQEDLYHHLQLFRLEEIRPMFSFPALYPGESIEIRKETEPNWEDLQSDEKAEMIHLGTTSAGYPVDFPLSLLCKHAFIGGVPGFGKTNTMLSLATKIWRDTGEGEHVPFLIFEPAKQEYRTLLLTRGMEAVTLFSPGADSRFPLHINPFEFPVGLTLDTHIQNLNQIFAGAFSLPMPSPHYIDTCIQLAYLAKGWNINERNTGKKYYPTMQELYDLLEDEVRNSAYVGETRGNLEGVLKVRVGSLLKRSAGLVYNVRHSSIRPEEWIERPVIIELEQLGEGPSNFMTLLISTLIREALAVKRMMPVSNEEKQREVQHVIFYEEAHNLIGTATEQQDAYSIDPKISATKYLVKMLAEVRALREGIVIADQLPSEMASQVLKNTGMKIGHRLTATDDRKKLGGTMAATPVDLEAQGVFRVGEALIFYEDLLRPFRIQVDEWEKDDPRGKARYDSPSDEELLRQMRDRPLYRAQLQTSADLICKRMADDNKAVSMMGVQTAEMIRKQMSYIMAMESSAAEIETNGRVSLDLYTVLHDYAVETTNTEVESIIRIQAVYRNDVERACADQPADKQNQKGYPVEQQMWNAQTIRSYSEKAYHQMVVQMKVQIEKMCRKAEDQYRYFCSLAGCYEMHQMTLCRKAAGWYLQLFRAFPLVEHVPELREFYQDKTAAVIDDICASTLDVINIPDYLEIQNDPELMWLAFHTFSLLIHRGRLIGDRCADLMCRAQNCEEIEAANKIITGWFLDLADAAERNYEIAVRYTGDGVQHDDLIVYRELINTIAAYLNSLYRKYCRLAPHGSQIQWYSTSHILRTILRDLLMQTADHHSNYGAPENDKYWLPEVRKFWKTEMDCVRSYVSNQKNVVNVLINYAARFAAECCLVPSDIMAKWLEILHQRLSMDAELRMAILKANPEMPAKIEMCIHRAGDLLADEVRLQLSEFCNTDGETPR